MITTPETFDEIERRALEIVRERRAARMADIPGNALVWLALAPDWTAPVAQAAGFPSDGYDDARQVLTRMADKRLCIRREQSAMVVEESRARSVPREPSFYLDAVAREELLDRIKDDPHRGLAFLREEIATAGAGVLAALNKKLDVSGPMARWATLAAWARDDAAMAGKLKRTIAGMLGERRSGEVLRWIEAARRIEGVIGGKLATAIEWAGRQIELAHRREDDERHLAHFYPRQALIGAFTEFITDGDDERWALHLAGPGGVGKTMLVRYIVTRWNAARGRSTARIDFDYLNPNYPSRAPGLLLTELAKDLRLNDQTGDAQRLFDKLDELADVLHERWNSPAAGQQTVDDALQDHLFLQILDLFVEAASHLPQPVVLLLDTCEELAKVQADGSVPDSVRMTFASLERLHERMTSLRVVFSGRRPLAQRGAGWSCQRTPLAPRPYLRLAEVGGFSRREADDFLEKANVRADLIEPILEQCREPGAASVFEWDGGPGAAEEDQERFHPFELALLADWARAQPDTLSADMIRSSAGAYVEARIVGRIVYPELQKLIPAVAVLGRFDEPTLRQAADAAGVRGRDYDAALRDLRQQEWIDVHRSGYFVVDRGLLPRLRAYYASGSKSAQIKAFAPRLGRYLERRTLTAGFGDLDPAHFDAFLRLLEPDGRRVARWWKSVEERFAQTQRWEWARTVTSRLLGDDGAVAEADSVAPVSRPESRMRAAVMATHAAATIHLDPTADVSGMWQEVAAKADGHPIKAGRARLHVRALAGQIAARRHGIDYSPKELSDLSNKIRAVARQGGDEQLMASCLAAIEAVVERGEPAAGAAQLRAAAAAITSWAPAGPQSAHLRAAACSLMARIARWAGSQRRPSASLDEQLACVSLGPLCEPSEAGAQEALHWLRRAMDVSGDCGPARQEWLDWRAPADTRARVRLEFIRATYPSLFSPDAVLAEIGALRGGKPCLAAAVTTVDGDRLASAVVQLAGFARRLSVDTLAEIRAQAAQGLAFTAACGVHDMFPPLFAALAEATAGCGAVDETLAEIGARGRRAEQTAAALDVEQAVDRAALRIIGRMRLRDEGQGLSSSLRQSARFDDWALLWELEALDGPKSTLQNVFEPSRALKIGDEDRLAWNHIRWRGVQAARRRHGRRAVDWAATTFTVSRASADAGFAEMAALLDAFEAMALGKSVGRHRTVVGVSERDHPDVLGWVDRHPHEPAQALLLLLRAQALAGQRAECADRLEALAQRIGERRAAEIALGEGQLLALRLPAQALTVLAHACTWFAGSNDPVGAFIAGTCRALAMCRTNRKARELRPVMGDIERCCAALRDGPRLALAGRPQRAAGAGGPLPAWAALEAAARDPRAKLDHLGSAGWRPWLVRLVACLAWQNDLGGPRRCTAAVEEWLLAHYGGYMEDGIALPAELDGWLSRSQGLPRAFWRRAAATIPAIVGFAAGAALAAGAGAALSWVGSRYAVIFPALIVIGGAILVFVWGRRIYGGVLSKAPIKVRIKSVPSVSPAGPDHVKVTFGWGLPLWFNMLLLFVPSLYGRFRRWRGWNSVIFSLERFTPYRDAALALPRPLSRFSRHLGSYLRNRPAAVDLVIGRKVAWPCWEALISLGAGEVGDLSGLSLRFRRTVTGARTTVVSQLDEISGILYWADGPQTEIARRGWGVLANDDRFTVRSIQAAPQEVRSDEVSAATDQAQVLHLIGSAVETASAIRLEVSGRKAQTVPPGEQEEKDNPARGDLLHGEELLSLFPGITLCILQATPILLDKRTSADREESANLRQLGAELFKLGIPFVMIVPPLPAAIGAAVIDELAKVLQQGHARTVDLLEAISAARCDLVDWSGADRQTRLEAALDLCLYAPQP